MTPLTTSKLDKSIIYKILDLSKSEDLVKDNSLNGRSVALCFFENSTRTKLSFELAAKSLGLITIDINPDTSSISKGETFLDTLQTVESMGVDAIILRSGEDSIIEKLQTGLDIPIISAGQGTSDHPTQGLLDALTIVESAKKNLTDISVTLIGDIKHSRVSASDIHIFNALGFNVNVWCPDEFLPDCDKFLYTRLSSREEVLEKSDYLITLRIQKERLLLSDMSGEDATKLISEYQISAKDLEDRDIYLMHPGPVNWGTELSSDIHNHPRSLIRRQVANGVRVRKAVLYYLLSGEY